MIRLIDADSIPWFVEGVGDIPVITKEEIDKMPTVDAIPIEWLIEKYQIDGMCGTETYFRKAYAVHEIIEYWRMENDT